MRAATRRNGQVGRRRLRGLALLALTATALIAAGIAYVPGTLRAVAVLGSAADMYSDGGLTRAVSYEVATDDAPLRLPHRALRNRRYAPRGRPHAPVALLVHGVHPRGIGEVRLRRFAHALAAAGIEVYTPELPELMAFQARAELVTDLTASARAVQARHRGRRVGAFGISFAGGLLLVAAASAAGAPAFDYVVAIGAHHDMRRLARYYAGLALASPDGARSAPKPHPYGGRILASAYAEDLFASSDVSAARDALALQLSQRYRDAEHARARLSPAGRARLRDVLQGPSHELQQLLLQAAARRSSALASLSPAGRLGRLRVPVFLLHGLDDPIVPSTETEWLVREVPEAALRRVLLSPALRHAEGTPTPQLVDSLRLVWFVATVLRYADR